MVEYGSCSALSTRHKAPGSTTLPRVTPIPDPAPPQRGALPVRELIGLLLLVVGMLGVIVVAFAVNLLLGLAVMSGTATVAGLYLTFSEG